MDEETRGPRSGEDESEGAIGDGSSAYEVWWVAGSEPGATRFGQLAQRLRRDQRLSVERVATEANLSVGSVRAVEQGRRAPSRDSAVRLLTALLPEDAVQVHEGGGDAAADLEVLDPNTGQRVLMQFKAKSAGDNRRWSADQGSVSETPLEARLRERLEGMKFDNEAFARGIAPTMAVLESLPREVSTEGMSAALTTMAARVDAFWGWAREPADDAALGSLVRRAATLNGLQAHRTKELLHLWDATASGQASTREREVLREVEQLLDSLEATRELQRLEREGDDSQPSE
ncbi:helix-turn-helix domain-containing protein [Nocardioidaceae bacterium]|nr:helix-turn-helix domain-containing protein [Nocardioidaceae bacterium]